MNIDLLDKLSDSSSSLPELKQGNDFDEYETRGLKVICKNKSNKADNTTAKRFKKPYSTKVNGKRENSRKIGNNRKSKESIILHRQHPFDELSDCSSSLPDECR